MESANKFYNYINCELPETVLPSIFIDKVIEAKELFVREITFTDATDKGEIIIYFKDKSIVLIYPPRHNHEYIDVCITSLAELAKNEAFVSSLFSASQTAH